MDQKNIKKKKINIIDRLENWDLSLYYYVNKMEFKTKYEKGQRDAILSTRRMIEKIINEERESKIRKGGLRAWLRKMLRSIMTYFSILKEI